VIDDPLLNYFALGLLIFVVIVIFYAIIAIHDIPYLISKSRNHPHQDAIHAAGWVSLFTLHALWPFLWIWAMAYRPERGWGFSSGTGATDAQALRDEIAELKRRISTIENGQALDERVSSSAASRGEAETTPVRAFGDR
jgi:hypothetical protein